MHGRAASRPWALALLLPVLAGGCAEEPRDPGDPPRGAVTGDSAPAADPATSGMPAAVSGADLEADVRVMESFPVQLQGVLRIDNPTAEPISFDVGGCPVFLRVMDQNGEVVWDQAAAATCLMILRTVNLPPGGTETFESPTASAVDILGDHHPDGAYRVLVYLALAPEGVVEVEAGEVELAIPR